jgi:hypothetical protein
VILEAASVAFGVAGLALGLAGWRLARQWQRDCQEARIIIAVKNRVKLDAPLVEWLAWNKALPKREQGRGGVIFQHNGVRVALARPKVMANTGAVAAVAKTRTVKTEAAA